MQELIIVQTNVDITVINAINDCYYSLFIKGVSMHGKSVKTATEKGLVSANYMIVRIPVNATDAIFINSISAKQQNNPPQTSLLTEDFNTLYAENGLALTTENGVYWFLIPQKTLIVVGEVTPVELKDITKLLMSREVYTVTSVSDNRNGSLKLQHLRCELK